MASGRQIAKLCPKSLSPSSPPPSLLQFLAQELRHGLTPLELLQFLRKKLRNHPKWAQFDLFVFNWASSVDAFRHDHTTTEFMVNSLCAARRLDQLALLLPSIGPPHSCPCSGDGIFACPRLEPTFRSAIAAFSQNGRLDDAHAAFSLMKRSIDGKPGAHVYNILMTGFCKINRHDRVSELFQTMELDGVKPDEITFNVMINSLCRNNRLDSIPLLFKIMKNKGCNPNSISFNTLISGFVRQGRIEQGIEMVREMMGLGFQISRATCDIIVRGYCKKGKILEACNLVMEWVRLRFLGPTEFDCLDLVFDLCRAGEIGKGVELVEELRLYGMKPGIIAIGALAEAMAREGRVKEAACLMERAMEEEEGDGLPDIVTFNGILREFCARGRVMEAERLRKVAMGRGFLPDGSTFEIVAMGLGREGRKEEALAVIDEMLDAGFIHNIHAYNALVSRVSALGRSGRLKLPL
ncbi:pentatricopeptide (PPR) repeat-containing protein [Wolffia australiana]